MRIGLVIAYDGTNYCGWQVQKDKVTIQQTLTNAVKVITGEEVKITGSGRTDSGVHAIGQFADFWVEKSTVPPENFAKALNTVLPADIKVISSMQVDENFNSIRNAKQKTYAYSFYLSPVENPLKERYATRLDGDLNFDNINKVLAYLCGEHDFKCFNASKSSAKTTVRTIYSAKILKTDGGFDLEVCGNGFLYNMVRIIAGLIVGVGYGKVTLSEAYAMIDGVCRKPAVKTMPAKALCLKSVEY